MRPLLAALLATLAATASAQDAVPDSRIQSVPYDAGRIVPLRIAPGFVASVAFAAGERIETVAVGNPAAWQVTASKRGDRLFIRALQDGGMTNLEVVTDARQYSFLLTAASAGDPATVFSMRFDHGSGASVPAPAPAPGRAAPPGRYRLAGSRQARPAAISDDGRVTRICWPAREAIPAIFARDAAGGERIVNSRIDDGCSIIDALWPGYRFVADRAVATARRIEDPRPRP